MLVNNAGGQFPIRARDLKPKGWHAVVDTNLNGPWHMTQVFGDRMLAAARREHRAGDRRGRARLPRPRSLGGGARGVLELTRTLAYEWGPRVRLNCVAPGPVVTKGFENAYDPDILKLVRELPLARPGTAREVANAVCFMASPAASYVTGEVLYVAGGQQIYGPNQALFPRSFPEREP